MDPVDALNRVFPTPESYTERSAEAREYTESCIDRLRRELQHRPQIDELRGYAQRAPQDLTQLAHQTSMIQQTGSATLENVQNVTSEIRRLDTAKENLTTTIRMLRQLKMLTNLYVQLDSLLKERRYEDMAGSVHAASDLIDYFRPFRPLPQISKISQEIGEMETKIYAQIEGDFQQALSARTDAEIVPSSALNAACLVLNSLDSASGRSTAQEKLTNFYCQQMLSEYSRIFSPQDEAGSLENIQRRFTYLKNKVLLVYLSSHHKFFPDSWGIRQALVNSACEITVRDLVGQLRRLKGTNNDQIQLLLTTMQECDDFERFAKCRGKLTEHISPFLSLWVEFQDQQLVQRIQSYARVVPLADMASDDVIPSSKELVNFYRALLGQLTNLRHNPGTLRMMSKVMADHLLSYASKVLKAYLPAHHIRTEEELRLAGLVDSTAEYLITTTHQLERNIATQIDKAMVYAEPISSNSKLAGSPSLTLPLATSPANASSASVSPSIPSPVVSDDDNDAPREPTMEVIEAVFEPALSKARHVSIRVEDLLVGYAQRSIDYLWVEMAQRFAANHRAGLKTDVSRVSPFMLEIIEQIAKTVRSVFTVAPQPAIILQTGHRIGESVCTGFLTMTLARVPKPVVDSQAEQLLLDFGTLKSQSLAKFSELIPAEVHDKRGANRLARLSPKITETASQTEAILKLLMAPSDPIENFVMNYLLLVRDRSTLNFRKILDVKGVRLQNEAISKFKLMASQDPHLVPENLLLKHIPTVAPPAPSPFSFDSTTFGLNGVGVANAPGNGISGFNMNQFKKLGGLLRRD